MLKSRKFRYSALAIAASSAIALSGCGASSPDTGDASKVLRVQVSQGDSNPEIGQALIDGFSAANPGLDVRMELITQDAVISTNLGVLSGANPPDVGLIKTGTSGYQALVSSDGLEDLADVWAASNLDERYPETLNQNLSYGGKHYSIGISTGYYNVVYYNKDLFASAGITEPTDHRIGTVDELYSIVDKLKAAGTEGIAIGASAGFPASWMIDAILPTAATSDQMGNYLTNYQTDAEVTAHYTDEPFVATLTQLEQMADKGVFPKGFLASDLGKATADFSAGRAGMLHQGFWAAKELIDSKLAFDFDWALLPPLAGSDQKTQLSSFFATGYSIPAGAKNIELAKKFLEYAVSVEGQQDAIVKVGSQLPAVNDVPDAAFSDINPYVQSMLADAKANGAQFGWTSAVPATLGQALTDPLLQKLYAGKTTPVEIADAVEAKLGVLRKG
jgi:raffinose/stachyose/melibiose transport system substrate-binding protein